VGALTARTLVASIREQSRELAADAAEGILDWADREPRLDTRYTHTRGRIETDARKEFLKLAATGWPGEIEVQLQTLADHGEPSDDERIEQLVQDLVDIGVQLEPKRAWPQAPLEPLADDTRRQRFLTFMEWVLDTSPAPVNGTTHSRVPRPAQQERVDPWSESPLDAAAHAQVRQSGRTGTPRR
jgi:hypothetical protein